MAAITYRNVLGESEAIFDYQLQQMALSLRDQGEVASEQAGPLADEQLDFVIQIWTIDGRTIYASRAHASLPARALLGLHTLNVDGRAWRTLQRGDARARHPGRPAGRDSPAPRRPCRLAQRPAAAPDDAVRRRSRIWWLAAHNLAPLDRLAREVRSRDARSLAPVPTGGLPDEVAPLASALNALLERLRSSLDSQRAFVADAAHELRSPLTALKLQLRLLRQADDDATRAAAIASVAAGIDRAARLVEQLLTLARSEPGAAPAAAEPVELGELAREVLAAMHAFAHDRGSELVLDAEPPVVVAGERSALAARRPQPGRQRGPLFAAGLSRRRLRGRRRTARRVLRVDDAGPGIPPAERDRVFDRFYRRAAAGEEGSGLGLAIVRSVAERHGATLALADSPSGGLRATLRFAPPSAPPS